MEAYFSASVASLHVIYSTSTGSTLYVVETLAAALGQATRGHLDVTQCEQGPRACADPERSGVKSKGGGKVRVKLQRAEAAKPQDLLRGDLLVLASGTWNTGGSEGQLHPYMHELLKERAKGVDLKGKSCALIALGDSRYFYTARAMEHLMAFARQSSGQVVDSLVIVNEPYGQEEKIRTWGEKILAKIPTKKP